MFKYLKKNTSRQKKNVLLWCDVKSFVNSVNISAKGFKGTLACYNYSIATKWAGSALEIGDDEEPVVLWRTMSVEPTLAEDVMI